MTSKNWEQKDLKTLKMVYGTKPNSEIANLLQRTPKAIERKAARLGLLKTKKYLRSMGRKV